MVSRQTHSPPQPDACQFLQLHSHILCMRNKQQEAGRELKTTQMVHRYKNLLTDTDRGRAVGYAAMRYADMLRRVSQVS